MIVPFHPEAVVTTHDTGLVRRGIAADGEAIEVDGHVVLRDLDAVLIRGDAEVASQLVAAGPAQRRRKAGRVAGRDAAGVHARLIDQDFAVHRRRSQREQNGPGRDGRGHGIGPDAHQSRSST
jgi:hypothetical protein